ncbi:MAG: hypothetical protein B7Z55_06825 [Planctomycetales bacterium 12-60-4]|nr:MAG: hypothetical protein B7Z55_06825 [Planctomycetales bacterium 12-60-4]
MLQTNRAAPATQPPVEPSHAPYVDTIAGAGLIEPRSENIEVAAVVPGTVSEVFVRVGESVAAGSPLFRLDNRQRQAELRVRQAQLAEARAQLKRLEQSPRAEDIPPSEARVHKAEADLKARKDDMDRVESLLAKKVSTQQEQIQAEQAFLAARALLEQAQSEHARLLAGAWKEDLDVARAQVKMAEEEVSQAEIEVQRLVVTAPVDATVLKVDVRPGEYVGTPPGQPLVVLGDTQVLHVRVDIDEQDLPRFRTGLPGQGFVRGDSQTALPMSFVRVEPYVEPKRSLTNAGTERVDTRVLQVIYALEPGERTVYVGQQIDVFLNATEPSNGRATLRKAQALAAR